MQVYLCCFVNVGPRVPRSFNASNVHRLLRGRRLRGGGSIHQQRTDVFPRSQLLQIPKYGGMTDDTNDTMALREDLV